jgi:N-acyl homoserine lactone hydrolase
MGLEIIPIFMGTLEVSRSVLQSFKGFYETIPSACIAWLITGGQKTILVDTGPSSPEWSRTYHRNMTCKENEYLIPQLAANGILPDDVDLIINTHLHWDHIYGNTKIPRAPIWVQREEIRYAVAPRPRDSRAYEADIGTPPFMNFYSRLVIVDGDAEVIPGVRVILTPGHTPGSQAVLVSTQAGVHAIAGDTINLYDSLESDPPWPPGIFYDLEAFYASTARLRREAQIILPSHDIKLLGRRFPEKLCET